MVYIILLIINIVLDTNLLFIKNWVLKIKYLKFLHMTFKMLIGLNIVFWIILRLKENLKLGYFHGKLIKRLLNNK